MFSFFFATVYDLFIYKNERILFCGRPTKVYSGPLGEKLWEDQSKAVGEKISSTGNLSSSGNLSNIGTTGFSFLFLACWRMKWRRGCFRSLNLGWAKTGSGI